MTSLLIFLLNLLKRVAQGIALLVGAIVLYLAYSYFTTVYHYNYRLTLEVEAGGKVYSGSSVISVTVYDNRKALWTHPGWKSVAWGGSPWVDLGERGVLLVSVEPMIRTLQERASLPFGGGSFALAAILQNEPPFHDLFNELNLTRIAKIKKRGEVKPDRAQLVWMPDPNRPRSAQFFSPNDQFELEARGINIRALYVEMTSERADYSAIYDKFPWLKSMSQTSPLKHRLPNGLNARTLLGEYR